jgi:hypothetical protein
MLNAFQVLPLSINQSCFTVSLRCVSIDDGKQLLPAQAPILPQRELQALQYFAPPTPSPQTPAAHYFVSHAQALVDEQQRYRHDVTAFDVHGKPIKLRGGKARRRGVRLASFELPGVSEHAPHVQIGDSLLLRFVAQLKLDVDLHLAHVWDVVKVCCCCVELDVDCGGAANQCS